MSTTAPALTRKQRRSLYVTLSQMLGGVPKEERAARRALAQARKASTIA